MTLNMFHMLCYALTYSVFLLLIIIIIITWTW